MLAPHRVRKRSGRTQALDGLDLEVRPGEILALLGPTGAGKSTTLRCAAGLERPDAGTVRLAGRDVTTAPALGRDVAFVFEGFNLLSTMDVRANIALPLRSRVWGVLEAELRTRVERAARTLHITHLLDRAPDTLSGGERQRVAIARALVRRPALYLLDEPLSALDLKLREELRVELRAIHEREAATMLDATHDYHGAAAVAQRLALIEAGRVLQVGTLDERFADPAEIRVGRLLGSPAMAFLDGLAQGRTVILKDGDGRIELLPGPPLDRPVTVGIWPDDVELGEPNRPGFIAARVWATDYRGTDRALQLQIGEAFVRLVVPLERPLAQGDAVGLRFPAERVFLFDRETGRRLERRQGP